MPEYPLLVFPEPTHAERTRRQGFPSSIRVPAPGQQANRLNPQFKQLQQAMERRRLVLQGNSLGIQPEQVLVLETVGSIDSFVNAIRRIDGLEWLGEFEQADIAPDHGFEDESNPERRLRGQLFLVMTNQQALRELQSLFDQWRNDPEYKFPYGLGRLRHAFGHLYDIRPWGAEDRIRETGLLEDWQSRLDGDDTVVPFEAELWFRGSTGRREQAESYVRGIIQAIGGEVIQQCVIPGINYHAVLGTMSLSQVREMVERPDLWDNIALLQCDDIMHIRPIGQCAVGEPEDTTDTVVAKPSSSSQNLPTGEPLVALLDGMPLAGHQLIDGRTVVDDPDDYESAYLARERVHATTMGSLICLGDINDNNNPVGRPLYVRPIMKPRRGFEGLFVEAIPPDVLPIDLVHRAVRRLYEGENGEPPVAPSVRVINLAICDPARPLNRELSSWARLLDWLSWKYNVLFVISAGNQRNALELDIPSGGLSGLTAEELEESVIRSVASDTRNRRLLSPSETLNGITVGATHDDASSQPTGYLLDPFIHEGLPSVISAHGPGYRRAIKPDILLPGGRQPLSERLGNSHQNSVLEVGSTYGPPGQLVAIPGAQGELNRTRYTRGTSNATALASRATHFLHDVIEQLRGNAGNAPGRDYDAVLLKTLLVHGASWANALDLYRQVLLNCQNSRRFKEYVGRFLGYGSPNLDKVVACTDQRVTVLGVGSLDDGDGDDFMFPLPPSLSAITERRVLTITLAWLTPASSTRQNYRVAHLWFNPTQQNAIAPTRLYADHQAVLRGTVQHEVLEGDSAIPFQDGDAIGIKVNCRADAGTIDDPIRYGLAVTLEVAESLTIPIYEEIRQRLAVPVPVPGASIP